METRERERETKRKQVNTDRGHIQHTLSTSNSARGATAHKLLSQSCQILRTQREALGTILHLHLDLLHHTLHNTQQTLSPVSSRCHPPGNLAVTNEFEDIKQKLLTNPNVSSSFQFGRKSEKSHRLLGTFGWCNVLASGLPQNTRPQPT